MSDYEHPVFKARAYLRAHEQQRRDRIKRIAWSVAAPLAFALMFLRP